jgi:hypothetical protein
VELITRNALVVVLLCSLSAVADADTTVKLVVKPGEAAGVATPVSVAIALPKDLADLPAEEIRVAMQAAGSQVTVPGQIANSDDGAQLWWVLPADQTAASQQWTATLGKGKPAVKDVFTFEDTKGEYLDLLFDGRRVTRYMYARDTSNDERAWETYKVFHHVFDSAGEDVISQGPGRKNQYPHHRGLFLGFSRLAVEGGAKGDFWHMTGGTQEHQEFAELTAGPVLARSTALIHWVAKSGEPALIEERQTTAYRQPGSTILLWDFVSRLTAPDKKVTLGGDPEHAGMQFRAHGDIDAKLTRYQFPEGVSKVQDERDMPFAAMNMTLKRDGDSQYIVEHINHPDNPQGTRYSAYRDYGRFGAFPTAEVGPDETLTLRYRIWVAPGEFPPAEQLAQRAAALANPPTVEVVK